MQYITTWRLKRQQKKDEIKIYLLIILFIVTYLILSTIDFYLLTF